MKLRIRAPLPHDADDAEAFDLPPELAGLGAPSLSSALAGRAVRRVVMRSQVQPRDLVYVPGEGAPRAAGSPPGSESFLGSAVMRVVRPAVYVETDAGVVALEPWGAPEQNYFWPVAIGAGAALAGAAILAFKIVAALAARRR